MAGLTVLRRCTGTWSVTDYYATALVLLNGKVLMNLKKMHNEALGIILGRPTTIKIFNMWKVYLALR